MNMHINIENEHEREVPFCGALERYRKNIRCAICTGTSAPSLSKEEILSAVKDIVKNPQEFGWYKLLLKSASNTIKQN